MRRSDVPTYGSILVSLFLVPGGLTYYFARHGVPPGDGATIVGLIALFPGFLMGGTALWVAAQG